jgi:glutamate-1-semialdehyde 2,1-aminomutase
MYQAGTLSGNPVCMAAGIALLTALRDTDAWTRAATAAQTLAEGLRAVARNHDIAVDIPQVGTMLSLFFTATPVTDWTSVSRTETAHFKRIFHALLERGVYLPPSPFESWFLSSVHGSQEIDTTIAAAGEAFALL